MPHYTLLFVHGTGVRNASYSVSADKIRDKVSEYELPCRVEPLLWGDVFDVDFAGKSLPEPVTRTAEQEAQAMRWDYLQSDPLFDLKLWCTPGIRDLQLFNNTGERLWDRTVSTYKPTPELRKLLQLHGLEPFFEAAWKTVTVSGLPEKVFRSAGDEHASIARSFAEAVTAQMMRAAVSANPSVAVPASLANRIVERLLFDWNLMGKAFKDLLARVFGTATATLLRPRRSAISRAVRRLAIFCITSKPGMALRCVT